MIQSTIPSICIHSRSAILFSIIPQPTFVLPPAHSLCRHPLHFTTPATFTCPFAPTAKMAIGPPRLQEEFFPCFREVLLSILFFYFFDPPLIYFNFRIAFPNREGLPLFPGSFHSRVNRVSHHSQLSSVTLVNRIFGHSTFACIRRYLIPKREGCTDAWQTMHARIARMHPTHHIIPSLADLFRSASI
jgi:hypothetical protein